MFNLCICKLLSFSCDSGLNKKRPSDGMSVLSIFNNKSTNQTLVYKINVCFQVLLSLHHCVFHFRTVNVSQHRKGTQTPIK